MSSYTKSYKEEEEKSNNIYRATITFEFDFDVEELFGHNPEIQYWLENHDRGSESAKFLLEALETITYDDWINAGSMLMAEANGYGGDDISSVTLTKV